MKISDLQKRLSERGWTLLPHRLMAGFGFAAHGYAKLIRGPENFASILISLRVPHPHLMAWVTSVLEFAGGISLMAGAFVLPLSLPLTVIMLTALFSVHFQYGFSSIRLKAVTAAGAEFGPIGYEMNLLYIVALLTLAIGGPGVLSVDRWLAKRRDARTSQFDGGSSETIPNLEKSL
jgi:putative oxidoreductase